MRVGCIARWIALTGLVSATTACAAQEDRSEPRVRPSATAADPGPGVDARAWLARSRRAHESADAALARGDLGAARDALHTAAVATVPSSVRPADARAVRQDLYYRLAELELGLGAAAEAVAWSEEGLGLGRATDVFTANLLIARGRAREAAGADAEAAADYHEALKINDALLRRVLQDEGSANGASSVTPVDEAAGEEIPHPRAPR